MVGLAASLPRRAPWWVVALFGLGAVWSTVTDLQSLWPEAASQGALIPEVIATLALTFGCVVALRRPSIGVTMVILGSCFEVQAAVPSAPGFLLICGLVVVFTGRFMVLIALDVLTVLWSIANQAGGGLWIPNLIVIFLLGTFTMIRRQVDSLGRSVESERLRAQSAVVASHQAAEQERRRLARDLHDVVAHDVTVIAMQCDAALLTQDQQSREAALRIVSDAAHSSLNDLRRMMNVLTLDEPLPDSATISSDLRTELSDVATKLRGLGLDVQLSVETDDRFGQNTAIALIPVLREGATNVAKYADPAVVVRVSFRSAAGRAALRIENGRHARQPVGDPRLSGGFGLVCLEERVRALDGSFTAGPDGSCWVVQAEVPTV